MTRRALLYITSLFGCFHLQSDYVLAKSPPPPSISDYYKYTYDKSPCYGICIGGCEPDRDPKTVRLDERRSVMHASEIKRPKGAAGQPNNKWGDTIVVDNRISKIGVIDFGNPGTSIAQRIRADLIGLDIAKDNLLIIKNWNMYSVLSLYSRSIDLADQTKRIAFEIDGKLVRATWVYKVHKIWGGYSKWDYLWPTSEPWVPAPEPAAYGAIFAVAGLGVIWARGKGWGKSASRGRRLPPSCSHPVFGLKSRVFRCVQS